MQQPSILYQAKDSIATITLNRPQQQNRLDERGLKELAACWQRFRADDSVIVGIVTGAGDAFCAGVSHKERLALQEGKQPPMDHAGAFGVFPREQALGKPLIAAINGHAGGLGALICLQCEIRIAAETATIGYDLAQRGLFPPRLQEIWLMAPPAIGLYALLTGEPITAAQGHNVGLFNEVVPRQRLIERCNQIAARIRDNAPLVVRAIKEVWDQELQFSVLRSLRTYTRVAQQVAHSEDAVEGSRAAAEGKKPRWKGR